MNDQKIAMSLESYSNYLDAMIRISILRDVLRETPPYNWETVVRTVLDIPKEVKNEP